MEIANINEGQSTIRVDQNILQSIDNFIETFGEHSDLCLMCLMYFSYNKSKDLFDNNIFDPHEFSAFSKISIPKLYKSDNKLGPGPEKGKSQLSNKEYPWNTQLEQALKLLTVRNIPLHNSTYYNGVETYSLTGIQILRNVSVQYERGKARNKKRLYSYNLNQDFENALNNRWGLVDPTTYGQLSIKQKSKSNKNYGKLYLFLCNLKQVLSFKPENQRIGKPSISILFHLCPINHEADHYYKINENGQRSLTKYAKREINKCLKYVLNHAKHLEATYEWGKVTEDSKFAYQPLIKFEFNDVLISRNKSLHDSILNELYNLYKNKYPNYCSFEDPEHKMYYINWLKGKKDPKEKIGAYDRAYRKSKPNDKISHNSTQYITSRMSFFESHLPKLVEQRFN